MQWIEAFTVSLRKTSGMPLSGLVFEQVYCDGDDGPEGDFNGRIEFAFDSTVLLLQPNHLEVLEASNFRILAGSSGGVIAERCDLLCRGEPWAALRGATLERLEAYAETPSQGPNVVVLHFSNQALVTVQSLNPREHEDLICFEYGRGDAVDGTKLVWTWKLGTA